MPQLPADWPLQAAAGQYLAAGLRVLPVHNRSKSPTLEWKKLRDRPLWDLDQLREWGLETASGLWVLVTDPWVVVDLDSEASVSYWKNRLGVLYGQAGVARTAHGQHRWYRLAAGETGDHWTVKGYGFHVRGVGRGGVVVPPSVHETGWCYRWETELSAVAALPAGSADRFHKEKANASVSTKLADRYSSKALAAEVAAVRAAAEGDRNNQLNTSAFNLGGIVGIDLSLVRSELTQAGLAAGLDAWEVDKTVDSGFEAAAKKPRRVRVPTDPSTPAGLTAPDGVLMLGEKRWADFDLAATGTVRDQDGRVSGYEVRIEPAGVTDLLSSEQLSDRRKLLTWEVRNQVTIYGERSVGSKLAAYLAGQDAPAVRVVGRLGWDDAAAAFICFEGQITAAGLASAASVRPDPDLRRRNQVQFAYGFEHPVETAAAVLREVLTFQDPTVTSVVGAWYMAAHLKGQIMQRSALFPVLAMVAPSGHGKTTGFPQLMHQLAGSTRGQGVDTMAAFRDRLASHRNGPAWLDDLNSLEHLAEVLRAATAEGTYSKKDSDSRGNVDAKLTAPVVLSGEGGVTDDQKALLDRTIQIELPNPQSRLSATGSGRPQWDDILDLAARYPPGLHVFAGTLVAAALGYAPIVGQLASLRPASGGRHADKLAVLRVGARVLTAVTGDSAHVARVDSWVLSQTDLGAENTLTLRVIPAALRVYGPVAEPVRQDSAPYYGLPTPVLVRPGPDGRAALWVNVPALAAWWSKWTGGKVQARTETESALADQARALGMKGYRAGERGADYQRLRLGSRHSERPLYQRVPEEVGRRLLEDYSDVDSGGAVHTLFALESRAPLPGVDVPQVSSTGQTYPRLSEAEQDRATRSTPRKRS